MKRVLLGLTAVSLLTLGAFGCRTADETRADYHQWRADSAAQKGDYYKAAKHERKADEDRGKAVTAPVQY